MPSRARAKFSGQRTFECTSKYKCTPEYILKFFLILAINQLNLIAVHVWPDFQSSQADAPFISLFFPLPLESGGYFYQSFYMRLIHRTRFVERA